ncbi:hypothetical protein K502DRAFT_243247 [Neoconidiobolus thromboides FSU 785]|nr:hypothetical protein K502DRAFT_243247 [Neoconidiobolus thromboides FSU 785]
MLIQGSKTIIIISSSSILANLLVILLLVNQPRRLLYSLKIIAITTVVDLLTSILFLTFSLLNIWDKINTDFYCQVIGSLSPLAIILSCLLVTSLAIERYNVVKYGKNISKIKLLAIISLLLCPVVVLTILLLYNQEYALAPSSEYCIAKNSILGLVYKALVTLILLILLPLITYYYIKILVLLARVNFDNHVVIYLDSINVLSYSIKKENKWNTTWIFVRSILIILAYNLVLIPLLVSSLWSTIDPKSKPEVLDRIGAIAIFLIFIINPIIILGLHSTLSKDFYKLVFCKKARQ